MNSISTAGRFVVLGIMCLRCTAAESVVTPPLAVEFNLLRGGIVTLVIEDEQGNRVRNLVSGEPFTAGKHTVPWDGFDEGRALWSGAIPGAALQRGIVMPGMYAVRGLVRDAIKLTYEFTVMPNVTNTPWPTYEGKWEGGWLGDHGNPTATLFIPAAQSPEGVDSMLLANSVNESGHALAWTDLQGNKLRGQRHLGGTWTGASHLVADRGPKANPLLYGIGRMDWTSKTEGMSQLRLTGLSKSGDIPVASPDVVNTWSGGNPGGLAVYNNVLVASLLGPDKLLFFDISKLSESTEAVTLGEVEFSDPQSLAFDLQGRLLIATGDRIERYTVGPFPNPLFSKGEILVVGLDEPRSLAIDADGLIYVAQWGASHQIKVFSSEGKLVRTIGHPGGPVTGPYDPEQMAFPYGISIDSEGKVWVAARRWWLPRIIRVWAQDGTFVRNFYGPTGYGGGGMFDSEDPTHLLYNDGFGGLEFAVDWASGKAEPSSIYHLPVGAVNDRFSERAEPFVFREAEPAFVYRARGHRYISNSYSGQTGAPAAVFLLADRRPQNSPPLMILGKVGIYEKQFKAMGLWDSLPFAKEKNSVQIFTGTHKTLFLWTDSNRDGVVQVEEFSFHLPDVLRGETFMNGTGIIGGVQLGRDLSVWIQTQKGRDKPALLLRLPVASVDDDGLPHYDLTQVQVVAEDPLGYRGISSEVLDLDGHRQVITGGPIHGLKDGKAKWIYHSRWPSLHKGHAGPRDPEFPGQLIATTRLLGPAFTPTAGEGGEMFALNSNLGVVYLMTTDGLFVDTLFGYRREGLRWTFPEHKRGMDISDVNMIDECFNPTIARLNDGKIVMVAGKCHNSIVEVHGLESIRRFEGERVEVKATDMERIRLYHQQTVAQAGTDAGPLTLARVPSAPAIDGQLTDWGDPAWVVVQRERIGAGFGGRDVDYTLATLAYDDENLYVAIRTRERGVLEHGGGEIREFFKNGGGVDLHLGAQGDLDDRREPIEGDVRLLVALVGKKARAIRYRPVVPGTVTPVNYHSSVAETDIDRVDDVSPEVEIATSTVNLPEPKSNKTAIYHQIEIAIPLKVLGWNPAEHPSVRGDIGVLVGEQGETVQRVYWHNKATGIVSDIPSEARLSPMMWGVWKTK